MNFNGFDFDENTKQTLAQLDLHGRMPHAVVIESRDSEKAEKLAVFFSMYNVCTDENKPCGVCRECKMALNKAHADIRYVQPPGGKKTVTIEQMRDVIKDSVIRSNDGGGKVYVFPFADTRLTEIVQNAFLKLLEEPPTGVNFILLCENSKRLLNTILSRVVVFRLKTPDVYSKEAVNAAKNIASGLLSSKEYDLMHALYALKNKDIADETLLVLKLILRDGAALGTGAQAVFDNENARLLSRRFTRVKLIKMLDLTENAKAMLPKNININLLTTWLCGEYRRISWQR